MYCYRDDLIILSLLEVGAKADLIFEGGNNLLHRAVECKYSDVIEHILSEKLIDVNSTNNDKNTALHLLVSDAKHWRYRSVLNSIVKLIIKSGADLQLKNNKGETPLDISKKKGRRKIIKILENPLSINEINSEKEESSASDESKDGDKTKDCEDGETETDNETEDSS